MGKQRWVLGEKTETLSEPRAWTGWFYQAVIVPGEYVACRGRGREGRGRETRKVAVSCLGEGSWDSGEKSPASGHVLKLVSVEVWSGMSYRKCKPRGTVC